MRDRRSWCAYIFIAGPPFTHLLRITHPRFSYKSETISLYGEAKRSMYFLLWVRAWATTISIRRLAIPRLRCWDETVIRQSSMALSWAFVRLISGGKVTSVSHFRWGRGENAPRPIWPTISGYVPSAWYISATQNPLGPWAAYSPFLFHLPGSIHKPLEYPLNSSLSCASPSLYDRWIECKRQVGMLQCNI